MLITAAGARVVPRNAPRLTRLCCCVQKYSNILKELREGSPDESELLERFEKKFDIERKTDLSKSELSEMESFITLLN